MARAKTAFYLLPLVMCANFAMGEEGLDPRVTLNGKDPGSAVAFSPDGKFLASGSWLGTIDVWEVATGKNTAVLKDAKSRGIWSLKYSPDGMLLASGSGFVGKDPAQLVVWNLEQKKAILTISGEETKVFHAVAFSPDGKTLATGGRNSEARLWDLTSGQNKRVLLGHTDAVRSVTFSPDGKQLATGSSDGTVRLWDTTTGKPNAVFHAKGGVSAIAFTPDGKTLMAADSGVAAWDVASGAAVKLKTEATGGYAGAFSGDGKLLVAGYMKDGASLWESTIAKPPTRLKVTGWIVSVAISPDNKTIATAGEGKVRLWDVPKRK